MIKLLMALVVYPQISETIYTPSLPDIARYFGVDSAWTGLTLSFYFWGFAVGVLFWGILSDWIGRRPAMLWGLCTYAIGTLLCALSQSIEMLIAARFLQAFGASTGSVVTQTILRDLYVGKERNRLFAQISALIALSPAIGPLIGGYLDEWFGFRSNFVCLLGIAFVLIAWSSMMLSETIATRKKPALRTTWLLMKRLWSDVHIVKSIGMIAVCNGIMFGYYAEAPFIFIDLLSLTPGQYGWLGILISCAMMIAAWMSHQIEARVGFDRLLKIGTAAMMTASMGLGCSLLYGLSAVGILGSVSLLFLGIGLVLPGTLSRALQSYQGVVGSAGALLGFSYYILVGMIIELVGMAHHHGLNAVALYFVALSAGAWFCRPCSTKRPPEGSF